MAATNKTVNVAMIGQGFMGRTHGNAWSQVTRFFQVPSTPVLHTVVGQSNPQAFAERWGWKNTSTDWQKTVASPEIDLVDIVTPNHMHGTVATAALEAGKSVACEKPLALTLAEARDMAQLAKAKKAKTFVWWSYRRCPAVAFAHQLVRAGKLGKIFHSRAVYLQDWADASVPLIWRFDKKVAGLGSHGDLGAHIIDMVRFVTGEEITEVTGAITETFIKERTLVTGNLTGGIAAGAKGGDAAKGKVTVDDATMFMARLSGGG